MDFQKFLFENFINIVIVKTIDNDEDIFTKNIGGELNSKHASKMVVQKVKLWDIVKKLHNMNGIG